MGWKLNLAVVMAGAYVVGGMPFAHAADKPVIAVFPKTVINDVFMNNVANYAKAKGDELGATVETYSVSAHDAVEEQVSAVEAVIARHVSGIVLAALDSKGLAPALAKAAEAKIPVVLIDGGVADSAYVSLVKTDNVRASALAADYAAALLSDAGKVAQLEGEPGSEAAADRVKGFHDELAKFKNVELVSSITGHWSTPGGVDATEAILAAHPEVNLIFASSDLMAVGAAEVLHRDKREDVMIVSFDGIKEGTDLLLNGRSAGDVSQSAKTMGERSVSILMEVITGKKKAADEPKVIDSGMRLIQPWNVQAYRKDVLGVKG